MAVYRDVLDRLLDHSRSLLEEVGTGNSHQMLLRIERTMNAALVDPSARATLQRGELEAELNAPEFDVFGAARPAENGPSRHRPPRVSLPSTERQILERVKDFRPTTARRPHYVESLPTDFSPDSCRAIPPLNLPFVQGRPSCFHAATRTPRTIALVCSA